jgi:hypothetical protein
MTSNLGPGRARRGLGFTAAGGSAPVADEERMLAAAKGAFLPEFLNRIDEIVTFQPLGAEHVQRITGLMVERIAERLRTERGIVLEARPSSSSAWPTDGFDEEYGARPLARHLRRTLERELTRAIVDGACPTRHRARGARRGRLVVLAGAPRRPWRRSRRRGLTARGGALRLGGARRGHLQRLGRGLRDPQVVAERVAQPDVDAVEVLHGLLGELDALAFSSSYVRGSRPS